jgi:outer membrane protein TolC
MMRRVTKNCMLFFFLIIANTNIAQDTLRLEQAVAIGLQNNYSITISRNNSEISKNNNSLGNAGFYPSITASGTSNNTIYNVRQKDFDGNISETNGNMTNALSGNIMLNWTLFDGFEMFIQKNRLEELQKMGENQLKLEIENLVSEISAQYYSIVQQQKRLKILENAMNFSNKRKELAQAKYRLGSASELNYLQALVDLNIDSTALIKQNNQIENSKTELNNLLSRDILQNYIIEDSISIDSILTYSTVFSSLEDENSQITLSKSLLDVALFNYRLTNSPKYPNINFFAGYNFSTTKYETGLNQNYRYMGPVFGVSLSYNIFDGFNKRRNSTNAKIQVNTSEIQLKQTVLDIQTTFHTLYNDYKTNLELIILETENVKAARKTTFVAYERYKLGEISDIELRQTQLKELETENQLLQSQYQAKLLETELLRLSGKLMNK